MKDIKMEDIKIVNRENGEVLKPRDITIMRRMNITLPEMQIFVNGIPSDISSYEIIKSLDAALERNDNRDKEAVCGIGMHTLCMLALYVARDTDTWGAINKAYSENETEYQKSYAILLSDNPDAEEVKKICFSSDDYVITRHAEKLFKMVYYHSLQDDTGKKNYPKAYDDIINAVHPRITHYVKKIAHGLDIKGFFDRYDILDTYQDKDYRVVMSALFLGCFKALELTELEGGMADKAACQFIAVLNKSFDEMMEGYKKQLKLKENTVEEIYRQTCEIGHQIMKVYEEKEGKDSQEMIRKILTMIQINSDCAEEVQELFSNEELFFEIADELLDEGLLTQQQHSEMGYMVIGYSTGLNMDSPISGRSITPKDVACACYSTMAHCCDIYSQGGRIPRIATLQTWIIARSYAEAAARNKKNLSDYLQSIEKNMAFLEKDEEAEKTGNGKSIPDETENLKKNVASKLADKDAAILELYRENLKLSKQLEKEKENAKKLADKLKTMNREKINVTNEDRCEMPTVKDMLQRINESGKKLLVVGGNERKNRTINNMIPLMICTGMNDKFDPALIANSDFIFFNPQVASHHLFKRLQSLCERFGKKFTYINSSNNDAIIKNIYEAMF